MMRMILGWACCCLLAGAPARADQVFFWKQGGPIAELGATKDKLCFLTSVAGRFSGAGEEIRLQDFNGRWILWGDSQANGLAASARCFSNAEIGKPTDAHWVSPQFRIDHVKNCSALKKDAWFGDAMTAVSTISGRLRGQGEFVGVEQSAVGNTSSRVVVQSCQSGAEAAGAAYSYFVGTPHKSVPAKFVGPGGTGTATVAGEFVSVKNGTVRMANSTTTICYFTRISGGFYGPGDSVEILPGGEKGNNIWILRASSQGGEGTFARARCYLRQQ